MMFDLLLTGGTVLNPASGLRQELEVGITDGRIAAIQSKTRMLAFVAVAQHGVLNDPGELQNLRFADPEAAARSVKDSPNVGVGIKVRLHKKGVGDNGREALRLAVQAGEASKSPVMVH